MHIRDSKFTLLYYRGTIGRLLVHSICHLPILMYPLHIKFIEAKTRNQLHNYWGTLCVLPFSYADQ